MDKNTIILVDKAAGVTSFDCLKYIKRNVNKKTGHCGTLDKFANGLIIACCGKCTKYVSDFTGLDKTYVATIEFGKETDTLDPEGNIVDTKPVPSEQKVREAVNGYVGKIIQIPPVYSAIHVNGSRSYLLAREGKDVKLQGREVEIFSAKILAFESPYLYVELRVSKGTYIRSYARDLAKICNSCGYLTALKRTGIGPFELGEAVKFDDEQALQNVCENYIELTDRLIKYKNR